MEKEETPIHQRLREIIKALAGGKQARFAEHVGIGTGAVGDIFGQRKSKPGYDLLLKILQAYSEIRAEWLMRGEGEMLKAPPKPSDPPKNISYNPAELFPEGLSVQEPTPPSLTRGEIVEQHGQIVPTYGTPSRQAKKGTPQRLPGLDLVETVAKTVAELKELRAVVTALQQRVGNG